MDWQANIKKSVSDAVISGIVKTMPNLIVIAPRIIDFTDETVSCDGFQLYVKGIPVEDTRMFLVQYLRIIADHMEAQR